MIGSSFQDVSEGSAGDFTGTVTLSGNVMLEMIRVPAGSFLMGSPEDEEGRFANERLHEVTLICDYWLGKTAVTQAQWRAVMGGNPSHFQNGGNFPVENVSWEDAKAFCETLNGNPAIPRPKGYQFDLPTEAQWEYACRAGETAATYDSLWKAVWHGGNSNAATHPVGLRRPNAWGFYDMIGNVWEWCRDWYEEDYAVDAEFLSDQDIGMGKIGRGGSWRDGAQYCRAACRGGDACHARFDYLGFRLALVPVAPLENEAGTEAVSDNWQDATSKKRNRGLVAMLIALLLFAICALGIFLPLRSKTSEKPVASSEVATGEASVPTTDSTVAPDELVAEEALAPTTDSTVAPDELVAEEALAPTTDSTVAPDELAAEEALAPEVSQPTDFTMILPGNVELKMIYVKAGSFLMGSPESEEGRHSNEKQHLVTLTQDYWLGMYEVTQAQWQAVMGDNPSNFKFYFSLDMNERVLDLPVENVAWYRAKNFCERLNNDSSIKRPSGYRFDLPTEAQWEYACRAGTTGGFNVAPDFVDRYTRYYHQASTHRVGLGGLPKNAWGFYDMHGNVCEWCRDNCWEEGDMAITDTYNDAQTDPVCTSGGGRQVIRGGSFSIRAEICRSAARDSRLASVKASYIGFRLALVPGSPADNEHDVSLREESQVNNKRLDKIIVPRVDIDNEALIDVLEIILPREIKKADPDGIGINIVPMLCPPGKEDILGEELVSLHQTNVTPLDALDKIASQFSLKLLIVGNAVVVAHPQIAANSNKSRFDYAGVRKPRNGNGSEPNSVFPNKLDDIIIPILVIDNEVLGDVLNEILPREIRKADFREGVGFRIVSKLNVPGRRDAFNLSEELVQLHLMNISARDVLELLALQFSLTIHVTDTEIIVTP